MSTALMMVSNIPKSIVIIGGGIQGASVGFHCAKKTSSLSTPPKVTILESNQPASAASGKGGGFMAASWGDGSVTENLHRLSFELYPKIASELSCQSYRKLPVLSVEPGDDKMVSKIGNKIKGFVPDWLDGNIGRVNVMGIGNDTAQITPKEFVEKMITKSGVDVIIGTCIGIETCPSDNKVKGVRYIDKKSNQEKVLETDAVVISAGPWSCVAEDWFDTVNLPMEGVKSTSIVWKKKEEVDATALFCGEDHRFGTHLEVYPRPDGTIYICGIGGSDYISTKELKEGAYRDHCNAKEDRAQAATSAFQEMSKIYRETGEVDIIQACMRPCPPDAIPYMGKIPGCAGAYINAGHNCWGIAWAPACGVAMSELILDGESTSIDISPFEPARFTKKLSGRGRKRRGQNVGEQW